MKSGGANFFPGLYGGLYGQNLPYKFKKSYGDFQNCNFEKSDRTTGPRSDLRPDSWSWTNSGLDTSYDLQNFRKRNFLGDDQGELSKSTVLSRVLNLVYLLYGTTYSDYY